MRILTIRSLAAVSAVAILCFASIASATSTSTEPTFSDNFSSYPKNTCWSDGATFAPWSVVYAGYGCVKTITDGNGISWLAEQPQTSTSASQTHAALSVGPSFSAPYTFSARMMTTAQLRTGTTANAWEVGWVLWDYADNTHFYSFIPKPNGWELDKEDPAYAGNQRFLTSGSSPTYPVGTPIDVTVSQSSNTITVSVNGTQITSFTDTERPYTSGTIGLYDEDASVQFTNVLVTGTSTSTPLPPTATLTAGSSTLAWSSTNATSCMGSGFNAGGATSGSAAIAPSVTTTYSVTCSGNGGSATASATVTVNPLPLAAPFAISTRVKTTASLSVRSSPSTKGKYLLCTQPTGALGTIVGGPKSGNGYTWWNINYDSGCDGWSVQNYLSTTLAMNIPELMAAASNAGPSKDLIMSLLKSLQGLITEIIALQKQTLSQTAGAAGTTVGQ
jgi:hypothetical protein